MVKYPEGRRASGRRCLTRVMDATEATTLATQYRDQVQAKQAHRSLIDQASATSIEDGYVVQAAYHDLLRATGADIAGYKVALTSKAMQEFVGVDQPLAGAVFDDVVLASETTVDLGAHAHLGVECEVAVSLSRDLAPGSGLHTRESIEAMVAACRPAFELIEDRNADYGALDPFDLVSENAWNAAVVLGAPGDWQSIDMQAAATRLHVNGELVGEGRTGDALGHPFEATAWLANHLNSQGHTLRAGEFVMTGSSVVTQFPEPGDELVFTIDGLGEVRATCS